MQPNVIYISRSSHAAIVGQTAYFRFPLLDDLTALQTIRFVPGADIYERFSKLHSVAYLKSDISSICTEFSRYAKYRSSI